MPDPNDFVHIKHPKVETVGGPVTRDAFETLYKDKGWSIAKPDEVPDDLDEARSLRDVGAATPVVPTTTAPKGS